eukprot:SAG31_NODE_4499_length_3184_cov_13.883955_1_plen_140_part_00
MLEFWMMDCNISHHQLFLVRVDLPVLNLIRSRVVTAAKFSAACKVSDALLIAAASTAVDLDASTAVPAARYAAPTTLRLRAESRDAGHALYSPFTDELDRMAMAAAASCLLCLRVGPRSPRSWSSVRRPAVAQCASSRH